jgi:hypothetical protein
MRGKTEYAPAHTWSATKPSLFRFAHCRGHGSATRNLSGVIICPAKRTAVIRRTPSPLTIILFTRWKSTFGFSCVPDGKTSLVRKGMRLGSRFQGVLRWNNAAVNPEGKKPIAARRAAIGGGAKQPKQPAKHAHPVLARNSRQIQVAALFAVHIPAVPNRSRPGEKTGFAGPATPGPQPSHTRNVVLHASPAGTAGTVAMAYRT